MTHHVHRHLVSRRRALQATFCSSVTLALNLRAKDLQAAVSPQALHMLAIGDFGTTGKDQAAVAAAMREYRERAHLDLHSLLLLGDNVYGRATDGLAVDSPHWRKVFEDMYPEAAFACPCYAVLGNHDYGDNPRGAESQLDYARKPGTRWRMPAKWYRVDVGGHPGWLTILFLDSNQSPQHLTAAEREAQLEWLRTQLIGPRGTFTMVIGHHPVYSNGKHGDTEHLVRDWAPLFQKHKVHAYLAGHDHDLQHLEMADQFTSFVISGGGGARTRALRRTKDRPVPFGRDAYGFTHLQVLPDTLVFAHHGVDGSLFHRFEKRPDGSVHLDRASG